MKIRMNSTAAGPNGVMYAGKDYQVSDAMGKALVEGGYARSLGPPPDRKAAVSETADKEAPEAASIPHGGKRIFGRRRG